MSTTIESFMNGWKRQTMSFQIKEPKRWFHYLGFKRKELDYTISFYMKSDSNVYTYGTHAEWK